ncbi:MAG: acyl-CoA dehydrogenase family protein [Dehalococcoidia bacterium]
MTTGTDRGAIVDDLLSRVERIRPVLERCRDANEANRRLANEAYDAMLGEGLFRMQVPKAFGGMELHPADSYRVYLAVSRIDASTGWNLQIASAAAGFGVWLPEEGIAELFKSGPDMISAGTFFPPAAAAKVDGGWRVTGRTPFASGADRANWLCMPAIEMDGEGPKVDPVSGEPAVMITFMPRSDLQILDTWHTLGMRGTGSNDIQADNVFVPAHMAGIVRPLIDLPAAYRGPLYRLFPWQGVHGEAIPSIATAEAAIDALVNLAATKTPNFTAAPLSAREITQHHAGKARGLVGAAKSYLFSSINSAYDTLAAGSVLSDEQKADCQLAGCFAAEASAKAVNLVHEAAGTSGIRLEQPFERYFRDAHTLTPHGSKSVHRYTSVGKIMLGLPQDWFALQL